MNLSACLPCARHSIDVMAERYTQTVEQVTGATVVALLSQAHVDPDIIVEAFFLDQRFGSNVTEGLADVIDLPVAARHEPQRAGGARLTPRRHPPLLRRLAYRMASLVEDCTDESNSECGGRNVVRLSAALREPLLFSLPGRFVPVRRAERRLAMATATRKPRTQGHARRPMTDVHAPPTEFLTFEDNAGDFYWTIIDGVASARLGATEAAK